MRVVAKRPHALLALRSDAIGCGLLATTSVMQGLQGPRGNLAKETSNSTRRLLMEGQFSVFPTSIYMDVVFMQFNLIQKRKFEMEGRGGYILL